MEMGYWMLEPAIEALVALRITPNMVTLFSLVPALLAGVAAGLGWFALAGVPRGRSARCATCVDGVLARRTGVASDAGEVFDAAVDRYSEFFFLAGIAVYYRTHWMVLVLTLASRARQLHGQLHARPRPRRMSVRPPRGAMRRAERAVYLSTALGFAAVHARRVRGLAVARAARARPSCWRSRSSPS